MIPASATRRSAIILAALVLWDPQRMEAKPLAEETCEVLKAEYAALRKQGVVNSMRKGPQWAKANLDASELQRVKRYLILQDHIKFRCFPPKQKKTEKTRAANRLPKRVPLPDRKPLPLTARQQAATPSPPAELDMEAIRDSLHGFQDALDGGETKPRPGSERSGRVPPADRMGGRSAADQRAALMRPLTVAAPMPQGARALTYSMRDLTEADLAASAGVSSTLSEVEKPSRTVRRRKQRRQRIDWDPFGFDAPAN